MKFLTFMELRLKHTYYTHTRCPHFEIEPTPDTYQLLRNYRCIFRMLPDGMRMIIAVVQEEDKWVPLIPLQPGVTFNFHLRLQHPDFPLFTDLTAINQITAPVYSNGEKTAGQLDLISQPSALQNGVFAHIELHHNNSSSELTNNPSKFEIQFQAKQAKWKYYLVTDNSSNEFSVVDQEAPHLFDLSPIQASDNIAQMLENQYPDKQIFCFSSTDLIPCQQQVRKSIQLRLKKQPVLQSLPNPSLQNYTLMEVTENGNSQKEEVLFQVIRYLTH